MIWLKNTVLLQTVHAVRDTSLWQSKPFESAFTVKYGIMLEYVWRFQNHHNVYSCMLDETFYQHLKRDICE